MTKTFYGLALSLLSLVLLAGQAQAVPVKGLYDAVVSVPDTSEAERGPAFSRALEQVLVKASGGEAVLRREGVEDVLSQARSLVQAYRYQRPATDADSLQLAVSFGAVGVSRALVSIKAPVWGANRPVVLAWVAAQSRGGRVLASSSGSDSADESRELAAAMERAARAKGVPVMLPDYDDKDRAIVGQSDIWGLFMAPIEKASEAYRADLLGVARISEEAGAFNARWALKGAGLNLDGQVQAASRQAVAEAVVAAWAEALAKRYAVVAGAEQTLQNVDVIISAVAGLQDYADVRQSLAAMEPVSGAAPVRIEGDTLRIRLAFNGELEVLREHLALERRLTPVQTQEQLPSQSGGLSLDTQAGVGGTQVALAQGLVDNAGGADNAGVAGSDDGSGAATAVPLNPAIQPIPEPGQPLTLAAGLADAPVETKEEDFKSLYPTLYFKWAGVPEQARRSGGNSTLR